ncbi:MAG: hypothetical protein ACLRRT_03175 [Ruthenibacterium lactatiformans]
MSKPYRDFEPKWYHGEVPPTSYRSIFKWGAPDQIKPPKESLYKLVKEKFGLTDADFDHYTENLGLDAVRFDLPCTMEQRRLDAFRDIVGAEYVRRTMRAPFRCTGKTMYDILRLRNQVVKRTGRRALSDTKEQIERIVAYCARKDTGLCLWRRSSVTRAWSA